MTVSPAASACWNSVLPGDSADRLVVHLHRVDDLRVDPRLRQDPHRLAAVAGQIAAHDLDVDVVQEPRKPPLLLVPPEPPRQRPEDRLCGKTVVQHPFVLHVPFEQLFRFVPGHPTSFTPCTGGY